MNHFRNLLIAGLLTSSTAAFAYIPPYSMVLSRTAENHGRGAFVINQDVVFSHSDEPYIVHERWTILNESQMRLDVEGRNQLKNKVHLTYLYKDGRRAYVDENGVKKIERAPEDWLEPFLLFRTAKTFRTLAATKKGVTPAESAKPDAKYSDKEPLPIAEPFMRLARVDGTTAYAIGNPTMPDSSMAAPGLWIEQDRFLVKKVRFPTQVELVLQNYRQHKDLWYPHEMLVSWPTQQAKISVVSVTPTTGDAKFKKLFEASELNFGKDPNVARALSDDPSIREFYTRLR